MLPKVIEGYRTRTSKQPSENGQEAKTKSLRSSVLAKTIQQGTVDRKRRREEADKRISGKTILKIGQGWIS